MARLVEIEEDELGSRIRAGADELLAKDRIAGVQRAGGAGKLAGYLVMRLGGRADVLLGVRCLRAGRQCDECQERNHAKRGNAPRPLLAARPADKSLIRILPCCRAVSSNVFVLGQSSPISSSGCCRQATTVRQPGAYHLRPALGTEPVCKWGIGFRTKLRQPKSAVGLHVRSAGRCVNRGKEWRSLGGIKWSSQHDLCRLIGETGQAPLRVSSNQASFWVAS